MSSATKDPAEKRNQGETTISPGSQQVEVAAPIAEVVPPAMSAAQVKELAQSKVSELTASADLPSTEQITSTIAAARESEVLAAAKEAPELSTTTKTAISHAEQLLASTERLVQEKNKGDIVQEMLRHGAIASQKLRESSNISASISDTFGEEESQKAIEISKDLNRKLFDVVKLLVASSEFRTLLQEAANVGYEYIQAITTSQMHAQITEEQVSAEQAAQQAEDRKKKLREIVRHLDEPARQLASKLQSNDSWQQGIQELVDLFTLFRARTMEMIERKTEELQLTAEESEIRVHADIAMQKAQDLIQNFGGTIEPLQRAFEHVWDLLESKRPELESLLDQLKQVIINPSDTELAHRLVDHTQELLAGSDPEVSSALQKLTSEGRSFVDSIREDRTTHEVQENLAALMGDLFEHAEGQTPKLKPEVYQDLQKALPLIARRLTRVPVARVDYTSDEVDLILDNIVLDLFHTPKNINAFTETHISTEDVNLVTTTARLEFREIKVDAPNIVFWYNKKTMPTAVDVGIGDLRIARRGLDIDVILQPTTTLPGHQIRVVDVRAKIHELDYNIKKARHNWMYSLFSPFIKNMLASRLEKAICDGLTSALETADETISSLASSTTMSGKQIVEQAVDIAQRTMASVTEE